MMEGGKETTSILSKGRKAQREEGKENKGRGEGVKEGGRQDGSNVVIDSFFFIIVSFPSNLSATCQFFLSYIHQIFLLAPDWSNMSCDEIFPS